MSKKIIQAMKDSFGTTRQRCYNPKCRDYKYYGGRGITICDRWLESFDNYLEDMGLRPAGMTLERKDNDGPYAPENCVWATRSTQGQNTRQARFITYQGETHTMSEWERRLGWKAGTLKARLGTLGYSIEEAMSKPVKCGGLIPGKRYAHLEDQSWRNLGGLMQGRRKLNPEQITRARTLVGQGATRTHVARLMGATTTTISNAVDRKRAYRDT